MTGFLVDTNVISEVLRPAPHVRVASWTKAVSRDALYLSVVSLGEIRKGLTIMPAGTRRSQLAASVEELVRAWFSGRILPITQTIAERWGILEGQRQLSGRPIHVPDAQIAATCFEHGLTLVTRNTKDFEALGVTILNPWDSA